MKHKSEISFDKAKKLKCPVCRAKMDYVFPSHGDCVREDECSVQSFECSSDKCGLKWTGWGLNVQGLMKAYLSIKKE